MGGLPLFGVKLIILLDLVVHGLGVGIDDAVVDDFHVVAGEVLFDITGKRAWT